MYFDCNCMVGKWHYKLKFTEAKELVDEMKIFNIKKALVYHSCAVKNHPPYGNSSLIKEISKYKNKLYPCFTMLPTCTSEMGNIKEIISNISKNKVKAIRFYPLEHNFELKIWLLNDIFSACRDYKIPVIIPKPQVKDFDDIYKICRTFPELKVVLTGTSYRISRILYKFFAEFPNFHIEISSYLVFNGIKDVVKKFGAEKLLFGTNMPFLPQGPVIGAVKYAPIADKAREKIVYGNAKRIFNI